MSEQEFPMIALAGMPNSGKTSLFNQLTGSHQRVANYPGITVERKVGEVFQKKEKAFDLIDLPGIYTLDVTSLDEKVAKDYLTGKARDNRHPRLLILVVDATNLERSLYLAQQLKELKWPMVIALNMYDSAKSRGLELSLAKLEDYFNCKVVPTIATTGEGIEELIETVEKFTPESEHVVKLPENFQMAIKKPEYIKETFQKISSLLEQAVIRPLKADTMTQKIDNIVLHPFWGPITLLLSLILVFQALFSWADPLVGLIENGLELLASFVSSVLPDNDFRSLLIDGIINGVGSVIVFLPHIAMLFLFILILEDVGYLGRAAFLMNSLMRRLGLPGKAVIPLLSSHACAIPGIMGARIIEDQKERLATIMVAPLTTCSARLPVYTMLIAALIPDTKIFGFLGLPGLTLFALYLLGISSAFIAAYVFRKKWITGNPAFFLMDLPPYRMPRMSNVLRGISYRSKLFLKKAGTVILTVSIILWVLVSYPKAPSDATESAINYSAAATIGKAVQPIFDPLGFDWRMTTALIPSFAAREVMVSSLATVLSIDQNDSNVEKTVAGRLNQAFPPESLMALLIWFVYAPQCVSTYAVMKKETAGHKWPLIMVAYTLALAYILGFLAKLVSGFFFF